MSGPGFATLGRRSTGRRRSGSFEICRRCGIQFADGEDEEGSSGRVLPGDASHLGIIEEFLDGFGALFDPDNVATSPIGRSLTAQTSLHNKPIGEVVYHLTGRTHEELLEDLPEQLRVVSGEFDAYDVHLVAVSVECGGRRHLQFQPPAPA